MNALLASPGLSRLGWALVHSLWEVTLVVLVAALALRLLRGRSPRARYVLAVAALLVSVLLPARRMVVATLPGSTQTWVKPGPSSITSLPLQSVSEAKASGPMPMALRLEPSLPWIVAAWTLGTLFCLLRLAGGWVWLQRLRWRKAELAPDTLQARMLGLCRKAGLRCTVTLLTCQGIRGPSVVGLLRPAILVPAGWFLHLPPDHVEALLAHELAHVLRHDYAVNLLQSLVEVLLFYHPGVWWLSKRIRAERELACDAFAVRLTGDSLPLAEALLNLETRALGHLAYELSPAAHGGSLMERIRQLLSPQPRTSTAPMAGALALGLCVITLPLAGHIRTTPSPSARAKVGDASVLQPPRVALPETERIPKVEVPSPGEALAVLVRKNRLDGQGQPVPHAWVIDIRARNVPVLQIWDAFDGLMKADLGPRGELHSTIYQVDPAAGAPTVTLDLRATEPASVVRVLESFSPAPRPVSTQDPRGFQPGPFFIAKRTQADGTLRIDFRAHQVSRAFLRTLREALGKEAAATDVPQRTLMFERSCDQGEGPKRDVLHENLTLADLQARLDAAMMPH